MNQKLTYHLPLKFYFYKLYEARRKERKKVEEEEIRKKGIYYSQWPVLAATVLLPVATIAGPGIGDEFRYRTNQTFV